MPLTRMEFRPGIDVELSATANRGGYSDSNCIRWRSGKPEVLGGWARISATPLTGICRALHYWVDLTSHTRIAAGTHTNLFLEQNGTLTDITPTPTGFVPGNASSGATPYSLLIWSLDNFGQNLLAVPSGQGLYEWIPGTVGPASLVTPAPAVNQGMFVMMAKRIVMAYGCTPVGGGQADPMLVRWCDQADYSVWTPLPSNQAGSFRLSRGNRIIGGLQAPNVALLWTDMDLWAVQYIGPQLVFSFTQISSNCGLISQKAVIVLGGIVYWVSDHGFFRLGGSGPEQLPCPIWDTIFKDLDTNNRDKCITAANYQYSEFYLFYPSLSGGSGEIDSYAKVNIQEGSWDFGRAAVAGLPNVMARTAWTDQNQPGAPVSVDLNGRVVQQESGLTMDAAGPVPASVTTAFQDITDGEQILCVDQFVPDFKWSGPTASLDLTILYRMWPGDASTSLGPFRITPTTEQITLRIPKQITIGTTNVTTFAAPRCREIALKIDNVLGWWRLGTPRIRAYDAGKL